MVTIENYDPKKRYRLCTREEYDKSNKIQAYWANPENNPNMNFLFGVELDAILTNNIIFSKNGFSRVFYYLNPLHPDVNDHTWTLFPHFLFEVIEEPKNLIFIPSFL